MTTIPIDAAQTRLPELIHALAPGAELVITEEGAPVARIIAVDGTRQRRVLGAMRGTVLRMAPDFDAPLEDFKEYMQ